MFQTQPARFHVLKLTGSNDDHVIVNEEAIRSVHKIGEDSRIVFRDDGSNLDVAEAFNKMVGKLCS